MASAASLHLPKLLCLLPKQAKIGLYLDDFGELPTLPIIHFCQKYGFTPYLPITKPHKPLSFAPIFTNLKKTPLRQHALGMKEPFAKQTLHANQLDMIICPLVAVDAQGNRMGMGGGFYDRTFAQAPQVIKVGWCYDFQIVDKLTVNPWDKKIDIAISNQGMLRF